MLVFLQPIRLVIQGHYLHPVVYILYLLLHCCLYPILEKKDTILKPLSIKAHIVEPQLLNSKENKPPAPKAEKKINEKATEPKPTYVAQEKIIEIKNVVKKQAENSPSKPNELQQPKQTSNAIVKTDRLPKTKSNTPAPEDNVLTDKQQQTIDSYVSFNTRVNYR